MDKIRCSDFLQKRILATVLAIVVLTAAVVPALADSSEGHGYAVTFSVGEIVVKTVSLPVPKSGDPAVITPDILPTGEEIAKANPDGRVVAWVSAGDEKEIKTEYSADPALIATKSYADIAAYPVTGNVVFKAVGVPDVFRGAAPAVPDTATAPDTPAAPDVPAEKAPAAPDTPAAPAEKAPEDSKTRGPAPLSIPGEDYAPGIGEVKLIKLDESDPADPGYVTGGAARSYKLGTQLGYMPGHKEPVTAVWVGYRLTIDKINASGGTWRFTNSTYDWLKDAADTSKAAVPRDDGAGHWILEGRVLYNPIEGPFTGAAYSERYFSVSNVSGVQGDTTAVKAESWLLSEGDQAAGNKSASKTLTARSTPESDLYAGNYNSGVAVISGWYNKADGSFSITKPANPSGYVFGRVFHYANQFFDRGSERIDPTLPISWTTKFKVVTQDGTNPEQDETDPDYQPILIGMSGAKDNTTNRLPGALFPDMTLGGQVSIYNESMQPGNYGYAEHGDFTFTPAGSNTVNTSVVLSAGDKNSGDQHTCDHLLFFVPINESDTADTARKLVVESGNLAGTSYTGVPILDMPSSTNPQGYTFTVAKRMSGDIITNANLSRYTKFTGAIDWATMLQNGAELVAYHSITQNSPSLSDSNIHAVNQLIKAEVGEDGKFGLKFTGGSGWDDWSGYTGKDRTRNVLWANKPDHKGWKDETEINRTEDHQLIYYDTFAKAQAAGVVVGCLIEYRGGVWTRGGLANGPAVKMAGVPGQSYISLQDVRLWWGTTRMGTSDTYSGTNGMAVAPYAGGQASDSLMAPYDGPGLGGANYARSVWNDQTNHPIQLQGPTWGSTLFCMGGSIFLDAAA
ncbi:MAG: hypothetical protein LBS85_03780, partial [Clostridiales Family XIII bacterium]|nr:hypothetical protein [Clostridiales Family XIII bacterium]